ncbi:MULTISPECIES: glycine cleavage system protein GcvH [Pseudomonas]|uniref:Glycine cleavage system H protein n=1 Tax=Pseudomonas quercus TaxID=2722792 RepID=A0ABX0YE99_9PSED|nr:MULTISPECIES: glycine cleavage system protein GcvH [Pseudomonas]MBF7141824.1 glycine cleavage system protein GcvH [Pseudomonas sp. LY10J]NJP00363.1 glycine cleavage system protein GcvH [Pseudomonas quercus]
MTVLRFTHEHEWLRAEADGTVTVGITDFAQQALGDVVFVQLPDTGDYTVEAEVAVLESVKAASSINMPLDGEITEVNPALEGNPELVNEDPLARGWFFRFKPVDASQLDGLLDQNAYDQLIAAQA